MKAALSFENAGIWLLYDAALYPSRTESKLIDVLQYVDAASKVSLPVLLVFWATEQHTMWLESVAEKDDAHIYV